MSTVVNAVGVRSIVAVSIGAGTATVVVDRVWFWSQSSTMSTGTSLRYLYVFRKEYPEIQSVRGPMFMLSSDLVLVPTTSPGSVRTAYALWAMPPAQHRQRTSGKTGSAGAGRRGLARWP